MDDHAIEKEIQAKKLTAPRITPGQIDALCASLTFATHVFDGTTTTVAIASLPNRFTVAVGMSACASPENFDAEIGRKIAIDQAKAKAREKLWEMEGYALKKELHSRSFGAHPGISG